MGGRPSFVAIHIYSCNAYSVYYEYIDLVGGAEERQLIGGRHIKVEDCWPPPGVCHVRPAL
jgi:hypothetical protein